MCIAVICFIEAKCVAGKDQATSYQINHLLFSYIKKYSWMLKRNCVKVVNWCRTVMVSRVWNGLRTSRPIWHCGKEFVVNACVRMEIHLKCSRHTSLFLLCTCTLEVSHYFIQRFDATNFGEHNENQTIRHITEILHDLTVSTVTELK